LLINQMKFIIKVIFVSSHDIYSRNCSPPAAAIHKFW
jgi:hypothetical protein